MSRGPLGFVVIAAMAVLASTASAERGPFHVRLSGEYSPMTKVRFLSVGDLAGKYAALCTPEIPACNPPGNRDMQTIRGAGSIGYGIVSAFSEFTYGITGVDYLDLAAGVQLETSYRSAFSVQFRFAYVQRFSDEIPGRGGRVGLGVSVSPGTSYLRLFARGTLDVVTIPGNPAETGVAPFTLVPYFGVGMELNFLT